MLGLLYRQIVNRGTRYVTALHQYVPPEARDRVVFHGPVAYQNLGDYCHSADVVVFPSVCNAAFGMSIMEAMACRRPVVATHTGGIPAVVVDGETGLLVDRGNAAALAQALLRLLRDKALQTAMGEKGYQRAVTAFSWDHLVETLTHYYEELYTAAPLTKGIPEVFG